MHFNQWPDQKADAGWSHPMSTFLASIAGISHWFRLWIHQFKLTFDRIQTRRVHLSYAPAYPTALAAFIATFPLANGSITWRMMCGCSGIIGHSCGAGLSKKLSTSGEEDAGCAVRRRTSHLS